MLYNYPQVENYGVKIDPEKYRMLLADVEDWGKIGAPIISFRRIWANFHLLPDIDSYLPHETAVWCRTTLSSFGFDIDSPPLCDESEKAPYKDVYLELRQAIETHMAYQCYPQLSLLEKPVGASNWEPGDY